MLRRQVAGLALCLLVAGLALGSPSDDNTLVADSSSLRSTGGLAVGAGTPRRLRSFADLLTLPRTYKRWSRLEPSVRFAGGQQGPAYFAPW